MLNQIKTLIQYLLPKQLLTTLFGWLAKQPLGKLTTWIITVFVKLYKVNMREALIENVADYKTFNDFFARKLKDELRPIDISPNAVIMPADGVISQCGHIEENLLLQAKGHLFTLDSLVACHPNMIKAFTNGTYVTTYLSPKDYHRFHMPCDGVLKEMLYVPGSLFSVNQSTTENIPNIFSRNERVICFFKTKFGPMAQIFVGATIVGSIEIEWEGTITPPRDSVMKRWVYPEGVKLKKGQDIGCFKLGSTVITLFGANSISLVPELNAGSATKVGQKLAEKVID